jgi:uncharacterized membrane protein
MVAPAVVAWGAHLNWLHLDGTVLSFMGSTAAVVVFTLLAAGELVADKLPSTPSRTEAPGLTARIVLGALSGGCIALSASSPLAFGAVLGGFGGIAGAFTGYQGRTRLVRAFKVPDLVIALLEDAVAIAAGFLIVSAR